MATTNIYNPKTNQYGYQVPGAALPQDYVPSVSVTSYKDNPDGSTTNYYSDGTSDTGKLTQNPGGDYSFTPTIPSTISSNTLAGTNPVYVPTKTPNTTPAGIIAGTQPTADPLAQATQTVNSEFSGISGVQGQRQSALDYVKGLFKTQADIQTAQQNSEQQNQLNAANQDLTNINKEIADQQVRLRGEQDAIRGRGDISKEAQQGLNDNLNDTYGRRLADLAIRQSAASGNVTRLQGALKDALDAKLAPIKTEIQYYQDFYLKNLDKLSDDEKAKVSAIIAEKKNIEDKITASEGIAAKALSDALSNGVKIPDAVVQQIRQNPGQAYNILATNGISLANPADQALKYAQAAKYKAEGGSSGTPTVVKVDANGNPLPQTANEKALSVILGSGKFTAPQVKLITNAINNGEDPLTVIKNQSKALLTGANQTRLENEEAVQSAMHSLKDSLNAYYAAGGSTGLVKGNFEQVANKFGQIKDPRLVGLAVEVQSQLQSYRNAISGTAYSDQEGKDIASVFPGINKSKQLNDAIFAGRDKASQAKIDGLYRSVLGSTYDDLQKADVASKPVDAATAKNTVNDFIKNNPGKLPSIIQLYNVPNTTDNDVYDYLKLNGLI